MDTLQRLFDDVRVPVTRRMVRTEVQRRTWFGAIWSFAVPSSGEWYQVPSLQPSRVMTCFCCKKDFPVRSRYYG